MAKSKTPSYVLTLKLETNDRDNVILNKRFEICRKIYNDILGKMLKNFNAVSEFKSYRKIRKELSVLNKKYYNCSDDKKLKTIEKDRKAKYKELKDYLLEFGLSEYSLINAITPMYKPFNKNIDNKTAQALASRAWKALEKLIYGDADRINFVSYDDLYSVEGKWNLSGITYRNGFIKWNGLNLKVIINQNDIYTQMALEDRIKYCRIVKKFVRGKYKYYVQLVLEGIPPTKINKDTGEIKRKILNNKIGVDIGIRTIAICSKNNVKLLELCPEINNIEHKKKSLLRKLDRQRRANNTDNYNEDGTIKKGIRVNSKLTKLKWIKSNKYIKTQNELKEVQRKQADIRKQSHEKLANYILSLGCEIYVETMNFKGLQKRSKETTINKNGKFNKKKRFGKSIANKAPSMLLSIIDRKLKYINLKLVKINTHKVKASQYNHFTDDYNKKELKDRWNKGIEIQRDIYSAFLIMNVNSDLVTINRDKCIETYDNFKVLHDIEIERLKKLKASGVKLPYSMGI